MTILSSLTAFFIGSTTLIGLLVCFLDVRLEQRRQLRRCEKTCWNCRHHQCSSKNIVERKNAPSALSRRLPVGIVFRAENQRFLE